MGATTSFLARKAGWKSTYKVSFPSKKNSNDSVELTSFSHIEKGNEVFSSKSITPSTFTHDSGYGSSRGDGSFVSRLKSTAKRRDQTIHAVHSCEDKESDVYGIFLTHANVHESHNFVSQQNVTGLCNVHSGIEDLLSQNSSETDLDLRSGILQDLLNTNAGSFPSWFLGIEESIVNSSVYIYIDENQESESREFVKTRWETSKNIKVFPVRPPEFLNGRCNECGSETCQSYIGKKADIRQNIIGPGSIIYAVPTHIWQKIQKCSKTELKTVTDLKKAIDIFYKTEEHTDSVVQGATASSSQCVIQRSSVNENDQQSKVENDFKNGFVNQHVLADKCAPVMTAWSLAFKTEMHDRSGELRSVFISTAHSLGRGKHVNSCKKEFLKDKATSTDLTFVTEILSESQKLVVLSDEHWGLFEHSDSGYYCDILVMAAKDEAVHMYDVRMTSPCEQRDYQANLHCFDGRIEDMNGIPVTKYGNTSGITYGQIVHKKLSLVLQGKLINLYRNVFAVRSTMKSLSDFAFPGDSGSGVFQKISKLEGVAGNIGKVDINIYGLVSCKMHLQNDEDVIVPYTLCVLIKPCLDKIRCDVISRIQKNAWMKSQEVKESFLSDEKHQHNSSLDNDISDSSRSTSPKSVMNSLVAAQVRLTSSRSRKA